MNESTPATEEAIRLFLEANSDAEKAAVRETLLKRGLSHLQVQAVEKLADERRN